MVGYISSKRCEDCPVVPLYFSVVFWMVCRREVVLNIHHLKYIDKELGREAISIFFYEFAGGLTLATQESKKRRATSATYMPFVGTVYLM